VLFKVQGQGDQAHYVYLGVWPHDDAISLAKRARLSVNPVNGIAELILADEPPASSAAPTVGAGGTAEPAVAPEAEATPVLIGLGVTRTDLVDELGIDGELADRALAAVDVDELLDLAANAVEWQGSALVDLASGESRTDVKTALQIVEGPQPAPSGDEDAEIIAGLNHPAARMQFAFVEDNEELRRVIEDEDFAAWRVFLHPEQRKYATQRYNGSFRLSGGAGTGKTVVLLHRARNLHKADPNARILLTTFTKTLADMMRRDLQNLDPSITFAGKLGDPGIFVTGVDAAVSAVLRTNTAELKGPIEHVLGPRSERIQARTTKHAEQWRESIESATSEVPTELRNPFFFEAEYVMVVLPQRVTTRQAYFKARRPGRGVGLDRARRNAVWDVVEGFRATSSVNGSIDFAEAAAIAAEVLDGRETRPLDHVLVDEGQDLNPTHWHFVRGLVDEGPDDVFIAEDSHQRIYGQRVVLGRLGIRIIGRSRRLALNYRTTAQNLQFGVGVLEGSDYVDLEEEKTGLDGYRSARSGPPPRLVQTTSVTDELDRAAEIVEGWLEDGVVPDTVGILVRDAAQANQVARGMDERGTAVRVVTNQANVANRPQVMTMHRAKGMEFSRVLIFGAEHGLVPAAYLLKGMGEAEREDTLQRERSLLYVAATRARDELVVLWTGEKSQFVP
jgi:superfamily I DNA/RNA helicase